MLDNLIIIADAIFKILRVLIIPGLTGTVAYIFIDRKRNPHEYGEWTDTCRNANHAVGYHRHK